MKTAGRIALTLTVAALVSPVPAATGGVTLTEALTVERAGDGAVVKFAVSTGTDVEVAVLGKDGTVIRHLAAGVLGGNQRSPSSRMPSASDGPQDPRK